MESQKNEISFSEACKDPSWEPGYSNLKPRCFHHSVTPGTATSGSVRQARKLGDKNDFECMSNITPTNKGHPGP